MSKADKPNPQLDALIRARFDSHLLGCAEGMVSAGQHALNLGHGEAANAILIEVLRRHPDTVGRVAGFLDFEQGCADARQAKTKPARKRSKKTEPCIDPDLDL